MKGSDQLELLISNLSTAIHSPDKGYATLRKYLIEHHATLNEDKNSSIAFNLYAQVHSSMHSSDLKIDLIHTLAIHDIPFSPAQFDTIIKPLFDDMNILRFWENPPKTRCWDLFNLWIAEPGKLDDYKRLLSIAHDQKTQSPWYQILAIPRQWKYQPYDGDTSQSHVASLDILEEKYQYWIKRIDPRLERLRQQNSDARMQPAPSGWVPASLSGLLHLRK